MMRGHQAIIEARILESNIDQVWVHVSDSAKPTAYRELTDPENQLRYGWRPEILIHTDDNIPRLDFRCLTGVIVHLTGNDPQRTAKVMKRINDFNPAVVFADLGGVLALPEVVA
jgi:hypothetical protein